MRYLEEENNRLRLVIEFYERFDINDCIDDSMELIEEMSNIHTSDTNLAMNVYITPNGRGKMQHGARIKVQNNTNPKVQTSEFISFSISDNPKLLTDAKINLKRRHLEDLLIFIRMYETELMDVWNGYITVDEFKYIIKHGR